jgi:hypothetical protein
MKVPASHIVFSDTAVLRLWISQYAFARVKDLCTSIDVGRTTVLIVVFVWI